MVKFSGLLGLHGIKNELMQGYEFVLIIDEILNIRGIRYFDPLCQKIVADYFTEFVSMLILVIHPPD